MKDRELPEDRMATMAEDGSRVYLYPGEVQGLFQRMRARVHFVLVVVFLALPWLELGGHPLMLLDVAHRRFSVFGFFFWGHDFPLFFLVVGIFLFLAAFMTALFGRVWCGWACPQTVFVEAIYRPIERWIEGDGLARKKLDDAPWSFGKFRKRASKWGIWLVVSLVISHSFLAYFVGKKHLFEMVQQNPLENFTPFRVMAFIVGLVLFSFGWFREQFCVIMCPYGRIQSVLTDDDSLTVVYDSKRGEPRRAQGLPKDQQGDCINCYRCVQVCPTGVDIRRGSQQLECIACTACIDACDQVMEKIEKPKGLIRYDRDRTLRGEKTRFWRPRVIVYASALLVLTTALTIFLGTREWVDATFIRMRAEPYQVLQVNAEEWIANSFQIHVSSYDPHPIRYHLSSTDPRIKVVAPLLPFSLQGGETGRVPVFVEFQRELLQAGTGSGNLRLQAKVEFSDGRAPQEKEVVLHVVGPF